LGALCRSVVGFGGEHKTELIYLKEPLIAAVIVNWNRQDLLKQAVVSLLNNGWKNLAIIVVDNGSTDGSVDLIRDIFPDVHLIVNSGNYGFARANNQGFERAYALGAEYIFLLNNDATVEAGCLSKLRNYLGTHHKVGAVAPYIFYSEKPDVIWFGGGVADLWRGRIGHIGIRRRFDARRYREVRCGYLTGCAFLVRTEVVQKTGGFDPIFGLYSEDVDLSLKIRRLGWELWAIPQAKVFHQVSASAGGSTSPFKAYHLGRSTAILMKRYVPALSWLALLPLGLLGGIFKSVKLIGRGYSASAWAMWRGIAAGMFNWLVPIEFRLGLENSSD